ncbi:MAG: sensor histidine kinase [Burkholderiales bacterium]|nr:sensor histidine kinase [Burkholderiales bacterium]
MQGLTQAWAVDAAPGRVAPPPADRPGELRALPDVPPTPARGAAVATWYRAAFELPPGLGDETMLALYVERACSVLEVRVNGQLLARAGDRTRRAGPACLPPQLLPLPPALLEPGANALHLRIDGLPLARVASRRDAAALSALVIGPRAELAQRHARATLLQLYAPQALAAALLLTGGFVFVLGWRHRGDSPMAWYGALAVGWSLLELQRWLPGLPMSPAAAQLLQLTLLAGVTLAAVQFLLRYAHQRSRWAARALALQCALVPASVALAGADRLHEVAAAWTVTFALQIVAAAIAHLRLRRRAEGRLPRAAVALLVLAGGALALELAGRWAAVPVGVAVAAQLAVPLALIVTGLRQMRRHGQALQASEASRAQLERRIQEATAQIEHNFRQLAELRVEQVTAQERKRIAGDLHDDLGAKLLTIVHTSDDPRIATLAREALEEMRLSVRGLTGRAMRLGDALGDWRAELMGRLAQSGIEGEWHAPDDDLPQVLPARAYVQTTRILREATNNIVKHSRASHCRFSAELVEGDLRIAIQDNGRGIPMEIDGRLDRGHGLASMKQRAKQMRGQCLVESAPGHGTVIRLTLPLDGPAAAPP